MAIDLDVVTRLNRATAREAAREAQRYFKDAGEDAGDDFGDGLAKGIAAKSPEVEKALKKVADASGNVIVQQGRLNALKESGSATDEQLIKQSERLARAHRDEGLALSVVNRALDDHNSKLNQVEQSTGRAVKLTGDLGSALRGIGAVTAVGSLPAVATAIASVAGALQQLSGAALAAPGILAGIGASAGTAMLGMQGMSDAFDASIKALDGTKASVEAANKALADLSPNAADAVRTVVGLKGTFDGLRDIAATNIFAGFSSNLKTLVAADLPVVTRGVDGISKALGQNLTQAMASLGSDSSKGFIERIMGNTANAQGRLTAAIDPIVHAVGVLTAAGSDTLPRLADAVGSVANRFNAFITTNDQNGNLAKWINDGITGLGQLGESALNIGKAFTAITEAAGGGQGLLGLLESGTGKLQAFLNSPQGQNDLRQFFAEGRDILGKLLDVAQSAGPVLGSMFRAAVDTAQTFLPIIEKVFNAINAIPGGAEAVVTAFVGWQALTGAAGVFVGVTTSITNISTLLRFALPSAAVAAAAGITAALAAVAVPAWLGWLAGGELGEWINDRNTEKKISGGVFSNPNLFHPGSPKPKQREGFGPGLTPPSPKVDYKQWYPLGQSVDVPAVTSYTDPVVTDAGGGKSPVPYIDPAKYQVSAPDMSMVTAKSAGPAPGFGYGMNVDPDKVFDAESGLLRAKNTLEQDRLRLLELDAQGNASQREVLSAKNQVQEDERNYTKAQRELTEAQQGTWQKANGAMSGAMGDLKSIFAPMDQDFGIGKGIPGIVENLVKMFGNLALGSAIGSSPELQAGAISLMSAKSGASGYGAPGGYGLGAMGSGGYPGDAALLARVPAGRYTQEQRGDLTQGLADCSSAVEDLVNLMDGRPTAGASMSTGNEAAWLTARAFLPGMGGPGDFRVGFNAEHTQATLPGGTPFNWGNDAAAARRGVGGTGADDPAFTSHYYRPVGAGASMGYTGGGGVVPVNVVSAPGMSAFPGLTTPPPAQPTAPAPASPVTPAAASTPPGLFSAANTNPGLNNPAPPVLPLPPTPFGRGTPFKQAPHLVLAGGGGGSIMPGDFGGGPTNGPSPSNLGPFPVPPGIGAGLGQQPAGYPPAPGSGFGNMPGQPGGPGSTVMPGQIGPFPVPPSVVPPPAAPAGPVGTAPSNGPMTPQSGLQSMASTFGGGGGGGAGGITPGGSIDSAMGLAATAADVFAPGSGQAAQVAIKLASRAVQFGAQAAAIGVGGLMQTFLPNDSPGADPSKSWLGKIAGGISGARPAAPNMAAQAQPPPQQQPGQGGKQGDTHNDNRVMIDKMETGGADGQGVASDIGRQQMTQYAAGAKR